MKVERIMKTKKDAAGEALGEMFKYTHFHANSGNMPNHQAREYEEAAKMVVNLILDAAREEREHD